MSSPQTPSAAVANAPRVRARWLAPQDECWVQLVIGVLCMVMIANLQYSWTLFTTPMVNAHMWHWWRPVAEHFTGNKVQIWTLAGIQGTFAAFVFFETWLVPVEGYLVDRFGARIVTVAGGVLAAAGWAINANADTMTVLYAGQIVAGLGAGAVYGTCVGNALKWFPNRRGLAAGITAAGFGAGAALTVIPISSMIDASGYHTAFMTFGLIQGGVVFVLGWLLRAPDAEAVAELSKAGKPVGKSAPRPLEPAVGTAEPVQFGPLAMVKTPAFWVMYVMFVLMAAGGLFVTANLKPIGVDYKVSDVKVTLAFWTMSAVTFALTLDRIMNGITRPFFGWVSDKIGRENTMFIAFFAEAIGILALSQLGGNPMLFVVLSGLVFFAWGEIYSLFPSTVADTYGWKYATTNSGLMYTAKGTAVLMVPFATAIATSASWHIVFFVGAAMNLVAALMAIFVLKPMRRRMLGRV